MEEEKPVEDAKKIEKVGRGVIRWTIITVIILALVTAGLWLIANSIYFANNPTVVNLRNTFPAYVNENNPEIGEVESDGTYIYHFMGTFQSVDWNTNILSLRDKHNKIYLFKLIFDDNPNSRTTKNITKLQTLTPSSPDIINILWSGKKTLKQVQEDYTKNPNLPLNTDNDFYFSIQ